MDMNNVGLYTLLCVKVFLFVKAQVTFDPDSQEDVQLQITPLEPSINVTTVQCYTESPIFQVQYVTPEDHKVVYGIKIDDKNVSIGAAVAETTCDGSQYRVTLDKLSFIADPVLVGRTFRIKVTLNANGENSTISKRTYTFQAPFNLTGSSVSAVLHFDFTWTCHVTSDYPIIQWDRNNILLGQSGILNGKCVSNHTDSFIYDCQQSALTYTLTILGPSLTEELQGSTWRCKDATTGDTAGSKFMEFDVLYPPTVSLSLQNTTENTGNHTIRCKAEGGKPKNAIILALQQKIGSTLIRNITSFTELFPGDITLTIPRVSYQDMGAYTCLASNGIPNRSNQTIQTDTDYLDVITSAKFEMMQYTVRSDIDKPVVVKIPFYRNPPANESDVVWTRKTGTSSETLVSSANVYLSLTNTAVQQTCHGVDVTLKGQSASMTITSFQNSYEGNYILRIMSSHEDTAEVAITLKRSVPMESTPSSLNIAVVGGAAGGGTALIVIIVVIVVVLKRRRTKEQGTESNSKETLAGPPRQNDDGEDGLKDNPLYEGNPGGANAVQGASAASNPSLNAVVVKPKKKSPEKISVDPPHIYAEVNNPNTKNGKGKQKRQKAKDKVEGDKYPNVDGSKQNCSTDNQKAKENEQRGYRNKDGLFYMDVKFDQPPARGKPTIRKEGPTGYAMIQLEESNAKSSSSNVRGAEGGR